MPSLPLAGSDARTVETTGPAQQESCQEALTGEDPMFETQYEALRRQGISRRSFLQFCSLTAASLGIGSAGAKDIAEAMETKPRTPVIWLHGLECTCCTESFIRSYHPVAKDLVLSMISLDYDDTIMAAAGHQAEAALEDTIEKYKGNYILAVEGNVPLNDDGVNCIPGGETFLRKIKHVAAGAKAVIGWGSCAAWGCVQAAKPNPTHAVPITEIITDKPIVLVPGCPPIPEVMTGVVTYILTYDRLPPLDRMGRPKMFYGQRIHDKCYRRAHFDAGQFVEKFDDEGAKLLPLQGGLQGTDVLQRLLGHPLERGPLLAGPVGPRLHRLLRAQLLRQGLLLRARDDGPASGLGRHRGDRRQGGPRDARRRRRRGCRARGHVRRVAGPRQEDQQGHRR